MSECTSTIIDDISKDIFKCRECDFFKDGTLKTEKFFPDIPMFNSGGNGQKAFVIGINPSFNDSTYETTWKNDLYTAVDYYDYKERLSKLENPILKYQSELARTFRSINSHLNIYPELTTYVAEFTLKNIYKYVFWSNLSFCSSQTPYSRIIDDNTVTCRVFEEEIPNCLEKGYLARYIKALEPEFLLLFTLSAKGYYYWKHIVKKLFPSGDAEITGQFIEKYSAHKRKATPVEIEIIAAKVKAYGKIVNILFFPHPNYQFTSENKAHVLEKVCEWFKQDLVN